MENIKKPKTFEELLNLQKILDEEVDKERKNGFVPRKKTEIDIFLSLDDEFQEWLRELPQEYNFKTWKEKVYSREKELEEFTDCLFFFLQYQNTFYNSTYPNVLYEVFYEWENYKAEYLIDSIFEFKLYLWYEEVDSYNPLRNLENCFISWIAISKSRGFTKQEILDTYWNKWQKNMKRINKDWTLK